MKSTRPRFVPSSTYRLQVHAGFPLDAARAIVAYLKRLGVGAAYTSPYFAAEPASTHGYDVTNHNLINPEVGGAEAHTAFTDAVRAAGMQHIVDFVPNHMGISTATNPWWRDVLAAGADSPSARFFDIDWNPFKTELRRKLLLPILGDQYGRALDRGELQLELSDGQLVLRYFDHRLPISARDVPPLQGVEEMEPEAAARVIAGFNGVPGQPRSFDRLHELLEEQAYRLAYWRTAAHEINYRRFFDVNTLAGLRVEDPHVFAAIHRLLSTLLREERVTGVRIDHPDGLFDPAKYFNMLQDLAADAWGEPRRPGVRLYVVAEKILSARERLPGGWRVHGTTGYNFLNQVNGLFVDPGNARRMRRAYARLTGQTRSFDDLVYDTKRLIMDTAMASELTVLAQTLDRIGESNRKSRDFTLYSLRDMLAEVVACFPVYRTYVNDEGWAPDDRVALERAIVRARRRNPAMESSIFDFFREVMLPRDPSSPVAPGMERREGYPPADAEEAAARLRFAMKFQQYTGPLQAKGLEDTAFYRSHALLSLNEVGGDPSRFGVPAPEFHEMNRVRNQDWPLEMTATSTHDTKLGEDVRARINVLSEIPEEWGREASKWMRLNKACRTVVDGEPAPDRNDEYRFYQTLLGVWPEGESSASTDLVSRLQGYMAKAVKEAKLHSSWINPDEAYEAAVSAFVERVLTGPGAAKFLPAFLPLQQKVERCGMVNSLSQVVLKIASPGVPDFYQGTDLWDFNLVDPDNRRPVDFVRRDQMLDTVDAVLALPVEERRDALGRLLHTSRSGAIKLLVTAAGLRLRGQVPDLFLDGEYLPLDVESSVEGLAIAFARLHADGRAIVAIAPHLVCRLLSDERPVPLGDIWRTSRVRLPKSLASLTFTDAFTGATLRPVVAGESAWIFVGQALKELPVALLEAEATPNSQIPTPK